MDLLNSGAYTAAVKDLETQYKSNVAPPTENIDTLEEQLADAKKAQKPIAEPTKEEIQEAYFYELTLYQLNTLS